MSTNKRGQTSQKFFVSCGRQRKREKGPWICAKFCGGAEGKERTKNTPTKYFTTSSQIPASGEHRRREAYDSQRRFQREARYRETHLLRSLTSYAPSARKEAAFYFTSSFVTRGARRECSRAMPHAALKPLVKPNEKRRGPKTSKEKTRGMRQPIDSRCTKRVRERRLFGTDFVGTRLDL